MRRIAPLIASCAVFGGVLVGIMTDDTAPSPRPADASALSGEYYLGDGLGANLYLTLHPDSTYEFVWRGCLGTYAQGMGTVSVQTNLVVLHPPLQATLADPPTVESRLVPIVWADRRYLVYERDVDDFVTAVNFGLEPRVSLHGDWYVSMIDQAPWISPVPAGKPSVPAPWNKKLLPSSVTARVTAVKDGRLEINAGHDQGLVSGAVLLVNIGEETERTDSISSESLQMRGISMAVEFFPDWMPATIASVGPDRAWLELRHKDDLSRISKNARIRSSMAEFIRWKE